MVRFIEIEIFLFFYAAHQIRCVLRKSHPAIRDHEAPAS